MDFSKLMQIQKYNLMNTMCYIIMYYLLNNN